MIEEDAFGPIFREYCELVEKGEHDKCDPFINSVFDGVFLHIHRRCRKKHDCIHMNGCCIPGQRRVFVQVNGDMHACERVGDKYPLGNVHKGGLDMKKVKTFIDEMDVA